MKDPEILRKNASFSLEFHPYWIFLPFRTNLICLSGLREEESGAGYYQTEAMIRGKHFPPIFLLL